VARFTRVAADHLRHGSQVLEQLIHKGGLLVDFFDGVPAPNP
jgi:hypothetical protein